MIPIVKMLTFFCIMSVVLPQVLGTSLQDIVTGPTLSLLESLTSNSTDLAPNYQAAVEEAVQLIQSGVDMDEAFRQSRRLLQARPPPPRRPPPPPPRMPQMCTWLKLFDKCNPSAAYMNFGTPPLQVAAKIIWDGYAADGRCQKYTTSDSCNLRVDDFCYWRDDPDTNGGICLMHWGAYQNYQFSCPGSYNRKWWDCNARVTLAACNLKADSCSVHPRLASQGIFKCLPDDALDWELAKINTWTQTLFFNDAVRFTTAGWGNCANSRLYFKAYVCTVKYGAPNARVNDPAGCKADRNCDWDDWTGCRPTPTFYLNTIFGQAAYANRIRQADMGCLARKGQAACLR